MPDQLCQRRTGELAGIPLFCVGKRACKMIIFREPKDS